MKRTSMYTAVLALSLAMALAGGGLACRTFRERLDALEEQAVLQHQRNVCGLEDAFAAEYDTRSGAGYPSSGADSVCARVGQAYTRGQWLILGSSTAAFALLREGDVAYSALPESVAAADVQQAAAATDGILLRGETLLLGGVLNTPYSYPVAVVTAADASEAFAARNRLLYSWLAVQAIITLAADRAGHGLRHPGGGAAPPDRAVLPRGQGPRPGQRRQRRGADALRTNCRGIRHADDLCKPCGRGHDSDDFIAEGGRA